MQFGEPSKLIRSEPEKTWIEICLLDEHGRPVPSERYRLTFVGGRIFEGQLDGSGTARLEDIPPGAARVEFPGRRSQEWSRAAGKGAGE
jgi:hypothetical protein